MSHKVIDAVLLAAGASRRMAPHNKLLAVGADRRSVVQKAAAALALSAIRRVVVVVGHQAQAVTEALAETKFIVVHCSSHADGQSASLRTGLDAVSDDCHAVLIALGDMPLVTKDHVGSLIDAWRQGTIVVPVWQNQRGNPVLWDRQFIPAMQAIAGDQGAKPLLAAHAAHVRELPMPDAATLRDGDTPETLRALPGGPWRTPNGSLI